VRFLGFRGIMSSTLEETERRVQAAVEVYCGRLSPNKICSTYNVPRSTVEELVKRAPIGIEVDSSASKHLFRTFSKMVFGDNVENLPYTDDEVRAGMSAYILGELSKPMVHDRYGVPETTLKRQLKTLYDTMGWKTEDLVAMKKDKAKHSIIKNGCAQHVSKKRGAARMMTEAEGLLMQGIASAKDNAGAGSGRRAMMSSYQEVIRAVGDEMMTRANTLREIAAAKRLQSSNPSYSFLERNYIPPPDSANNGIVPFTKKARLSLLRAKAGNPLLEIEFRKKWERMYEEHHENGYMMDSTPAPEDIYAYDEMGCDWMAKWPATFNDDFSGINKAIKKYYVATGDNHSSFWTTISFTCTLTPEGEGLVLAPLVIHQGGTEDSMPASVAMYLPEDYLVHATKSGYQDGDGMNLVYGQIIQHREQLGLSDRTGFVLGDGYDGHFNGPTMEYALKNMIQPFVLRSQNSTKDQVNDNGPNRRLKAIFATYLQKWISKYPGVAFNAQWFNLVFSEAWKEFATSPGLSNCI